MPEILSLDADAHSIGGAAVGHRDAFLRAVNGAKREVAASEPNLEAGGAFLP